MFGAFREGFVFFCGAQLLEQSDLLLGEALGRFGYELYEQISRWVAANGSNALAAQALNRTIGGAGLDFDGAGAVGRLNRQLAAEGEKGG